PTVDQASRNRLGADRSRSGSGGVQMKDRRVKGTTLQVSTRSSPTNNDRSVNLMTTQHDPLETPGGDSLETPLDRLSASRRRFLSLASLGTGAVALSACAT